MKDRKQRGFGALGVFLLIIILACLGGVGYYVWHKNHTEKKDTSTASKTSSQQDSTAKKQQDQPTVHTTAEAVQVVQSVYDDANAYVQRTTNADQGEVDAVKDRLATQLYNKLSNGIAHGVAYDQIMCTQMQPDSITATLSSATSSTATVQVTAQFGTTERNIAVAVDLATLKLTAITCPQ